MFASRTTMSVGSAIAAATELLELGYELFFVDG
jgi:hypothetical protein